MPKIEESSGSEKWEKPKKTTKSKFGRLGSRKISSSEKTKSAQKGDRVGKNEIEKLPKTKSQEPKSGSRLRNLFKKKSSEEKSSTESTEEKSRTPPLHTRKGSTKNLKEEIPQDYEDLPDTEATEDNS